MGQCTVNYLYDVVCSSSNCNIESNCRNGSLRSEPPIKAISPNGGIIHVLI